MANKALLACSASNVQPVNRAFSTSFSPLLVGLSPPPVLFNAASSRTSASSSRLSLVVKAQLKDDGNGRAIKPVDLKAGESFHNKGTIFVTSPYVRTPWNTSEDESEIKILLDMAGYGAENIQVKVKDDVLIINEDSNGDCRIQLPTSKCCKEDISALYKNGVLHVTVPKITNFDPKIIHIPVKSIN